MSQYKCWLSVLLFPSTSCLDMGHGAFDDTRQVLKLEQPSLETTWHLVSEMRSHDLLLHVGDLSYADSYEPIVCCDTMQVYTSMHIFVQHSEMNTFAN